RPTSSATSSRACPSPAPAVERGAAGEDGRRMNRRAIGCTTRGWMLVGAGIGLLAGGRVLAADELSVLAFGALGLVMCSVLWVMIARPRLEVARTIDPHRL